MGRKKGSGRKLECLECFCCKTRIFRKVSDLLLWCGEYSLKPNVTWVKEIKDLGRLRLIWCQNQTDQFNSHGFSPRNASPRHTADIQTILEKEKTSVFISNVNVNPFINDVVSGCPFKEIL